MASTKSDQSEKAADQSASKASEADGQPDPASLVSESNPVELERDGKTRTVTSPAEYVQLTFDGWAAK